MEREKGLVFVALSIIVLIFALVAVGIRPTFAQAPPAIRIGTEPSAISLAFWWADEQGIYKKYNLQVTETMFNAAFLGLLAIGSGQGDISFQSEPPTVVNIAKGIDAVVVGMVARGPEFAKLVAKKEIKKVQDLAGKRVAWQRGTGAEFAFGKYLQGRNIDVSALQHVDLPVTEAVPLLIKGDLDAIFYWEPFARKALEAGKDRVHVLATSRGVYEPNFLLTVRRTFAQEHPEALRRFLRVLIEATAAIRENPEKAAALYQRRTRVGAKEAREAIGDYEHMVVLDAQVIPTLQEVAAWLQGAGKIKESPNWQRVIDPGYLRAVAPEAVRGIPW